MFKRLLSLAALTVFAAGVAASPSHAQAAPAQTVKCADGTTSTATGKGACSHHGGIAHSTAGGAATTNAPPPAAPPPAPAAASGSPVKCADGTMGTSGRGACSHHGGIAHSTGAAATTTKPVPPAAPAMAPTPTAPPAATQAPRNATGPGSGPNDPRGAIAKCKDGTYSHSKTHTGACSHHGGVQQWLDQPPQQ